MASIQCAIELYDGVSPVLREMVVSLEGVSGRFTQFANEMGAFAPDSAGLEVFGQAFSRLAGEAEGAAAVLSEILTVSQGISGVFSEDVFLPLVGGAGIAVAGIAEIEAAAERSAAGMPLVFAPALMQVTGLFEEMSGQVQGTFAQVGRDAAAVAGRLPGHFAGPLAQISGMFSAMAASARASMESIAGSAAAAVRAVNQVSAAASRASAAPMVVNQASTAASQASVLPMEVNGGGGVVPMAMIQPMGLELPEPEVYWSREIQPMGMPPAVTVTVHNENHISSEADVEAVLRTLEMRLSDAVVSSVEGVYA
ncbi:MAG: hypothetical protein FWD99_06415 [Oscillospiraceae bacterium]|nr:hypothetical protein [Oscillospiraceae bacterium]